VLDLCLAPRAAGDLVFLPLDPDLEPLCLFLSLDLDRFLGGGEADLFLRGGEGERPPLPLAGEGERFFAGCGVDFFGSFFSTFFSSLTFLSSFLSAGFFFFTAFFLPLDLDLLESLLLESELLLLELLELLSFLFFFEDLSLGLDFLSSSELLEDDELEDDLLLCFFLFFVITTLLLVTPGPRRCTHIAHGLEIVHLPSC